jgi:hypothetical protein
MLKRDFTHCFFFSCNSFPIDSHIHQAFVYVNDVFPLVDMQYSQRAMLMDGDFREHLGHYRTHRRILRDCVATLTLRDRYLPEELSSRTRTVLVLNHPQSSIIQRHDLGAGKW